MYRSKWEQWYDNLPSHTKIWLKKQPVWHDRDMFIAIVGSMVLGAIIGKLV